MTAWFKKQWGNPVVRDTVLAALATLIAGLSVYFKTPALIPVYLVIRAAVAQYVKTASKGTVEVPPAA